MEHLYEPLPRGQNEAPACNYSDNLIHLETDDHTGEQSLQELKPLDLGLLSNSKVAPGANFQVCVPILHMAAKEGNVCEMKRIVSEFPESIMERHAPSGETPLHVAVRFGRRKAVKFLVDRLREGPYFYDVVNRKDSGGDTVFHLATSRKQLHTLNLLLDYGPATAGSGKVEVNAKNNKGHTALDLLHVLPQAGNINSEVEKVLRGAGVMRSRDLAKHNQQDRNDHVIEAGSRFHAPSCRKATNSDSIMAACYAALLLATFFAAITYHAALRPVGLQSGSAALPSYDPNSSFHKVWGQEPATRYHLFVLFNSVAFFTSVGIVLILLQDLHLFPWLQVSVSSITAAYVFAVMCNSAQEVTTVILVGASILLVATLKCLALDKALLHLLKWQFIRLRIA